MPVKFKLNNLAQVVRLNENEIKGNDKYFQKTKDGKTLLRNVMKRYIPDEIINATKQGFSAPDASWFKGDSIDYVKKLIFNDKAHMYEFLNKNSVQELVKEHISGSQNRRLFIWSLLNFENWLDTYLVK